MKRIFCVFLFLVIILSSNAAADRHIEIQGVFSGTLSGKVVSCDIYEQNQTSAIIVSTVFPEFALKLRHLPDQLYFFLHTIHQIPGLQAAASDHDLTSFFQQLDRADRTGRYAGSLFSDAFISHVYTFQLSDLTGFLRSQDQTEHMTEDSNPITHNISFANLLEKWAERTFSGLDPIIRWTDYGDGGYTSILFLHQDETLLSISADNSDKNQTHLIVSHQENGKNYFIDVFYQYEINQLSIDSALYSTSSSSYSAAISGNPIYSETVFFSLNPDDSTGFLYSLNSAHLSSPFDITGTMIIRNGNLEIQAEAYIRNREEEKLNIHIYEEELQGSISFSDKTVKDYGNQKDNTEMLLSVASGFTALAAEVIPILPADYQKILIHSLFQ